MIRLYFENEMKSNQMNNPQKIKTFFEFKLLFKICTSIRNIAARMQKMWEKNYEVFFNPMINDEFEKIDGLS